MAEVTKKVRRGITNDLRATSRLKFSERDADPTNCLFKGHLESVEVKEAKIGEETTGMPSFNGLTVPVLQLTFASNHEAEADRRYYSQRFFPAESNAETIPNGKNSWRVDYIFQYLKHYLTVFLGNRPLTEAEEDMMTLSFEDFDDNGEYVEVAPEEVIAGWKKVFDGFTAIMNGTVTEDAVPVYKTKDGKFAPIWMKLLRYVKNKDAWRAVAGGNQSGDLALPGFVGEGVIERYRPNVLPNIKVDVTKESIRPKEVNKAPNIPAGVPAAGVVAPSMGAMPMEPMGGDFGAAASDLPF